MQALTKTSCRICFTACSVAATDVSDVAKVFYEIVGYEILPIDIPQKICLECLENLSKLKTFKETCDKSEKFLQKLRQEQIFPDKIFIQEFNSEISIKQENLVESDGCESIAMELVEYQLTPELEPKLEPVPIEIHVIPKVESKVFTSTTKKRIDLEKPRRVRVWEYHELQNYLQVNCLEPTEFHSFILKHKLSEHDRCQLPPNQDLEIYETNNSDQFLLSCTYCSFKETKKAIQHHCETKCKKNMLRCSCTSEFFCLDMLRNHISIRHPKKRVLYRKLQCNLCQFSCCYETTMEKHCTRMHKKEVTELEMCVECRETFYCDDLKLQHIVFRCNGGDKSVQIPFRAIMGRDINVKEHKLKSKLSKSEKGRIWRQQKVICQLCGEEVNIDYLPIHIKKFHTNIRYECDYCGKSYVEKKHILRHIQTMHLGYANYPCKHCDKVFRYPYPLDQHTQTKHSTNPQPHVCDLCGKRYARVNDLKSHKATHSEIRTVPCPQCDALFYNIKQLAAHRRTVHSTKSYPCPTCSKVFKCPRLLRQHKQSHEPNQYFCPVCPMSFSVNPSLRQHVAVKHPEYDMPPPGTILRNKNVKQCIEK